MWDKAKLIVSFIMNRVIVHVDRQSHDKEWLLSLTDQEYTDRTILALADIKYVLLGPHLDPLTIKLEKD